jgi:hypothetical protein
MDSWFDRLKAEDDIPLLRVKGDGMTVILDDNSIMTRSDRFSNLIEIIKKRGQSDFGNAKCPEGVVYLIYRRNIGQIEPLYVGKAAVCGKKVGELSALFGKSGFIRFDHRTGSNGHIGNLNEARLAVANGKPHGYVTWVSRLFEYVRIPKLKRPVFINMEIWERESVSCVSELEHVSVETEEALRIEIIRQSGRSTSLLNKIGNGEQ